MTRKTLIKAAAVAACLCAMAAAQGGAPVIPSGGIPQLKITTRNNTVPGTGSASSCTGGTACGSTYAGGGSFSYVQMTEFDLTVPGNERMNVKKTALPDSIRRRGNSTSNATKIPFRIKFDQKTSLFGREAARSWVLLANYYDNANALNSVAFELGRRMGLHGTPTVQYVELTLNGTYRGIYQLTEQVQVNPGRVDIDEERGWLIELDYHSPDRTECNSWWHIASPSCLGVYIKSPEDLPSASAYQFVKDDFNKINNAIRQSGNTWRDMVDFQSFAKYILIQQAMDNFDFNSKVEGRGMGGQYDQHGLPGSNFMFKDHCHKRMYGGPLWDFDLAAGVLPSATGSCAQFAHYCEYQTPMRPRNPFYQKMWDDPAFQKVVKELWTKHKSDFDAMASSGGLIDQIAAHLKSRIQANCSSVSYQSGGWGGMGGGCNSQFNEQSYMSEIQKLKTWWGQRMTHVNTQITALSGNDSYTQAAEDPCPKGSTGGDGPFTLTISVNPTAGGTVTVKVGNEAAKPYTGAVSITGNNTPVVVTATANEGYTFTEWSGALTTNMETQKNNASMNWNISSDRSLTANFRNENDPVTCPANQFALTVNISGGGTVTRNPQQDCYNNGTSVTLTASPSGGNTFTIWEGDISQNTPTSQSITVSMSRARTVTANFSGNSSISFCGSTAMSVRTRASLRADAKGVTALLPKDHGYTSYRLIDLQGREIKSGKIGAGVNDLRFSNVRPGVVFLRLDGGKNGSTTLRAMAVR